jgi:hypothetical protein
MLIPESSWPKLRRRARTPVFAPVIERLRKDIRVASDTSLGVPNQPAGHYHHYFCPEHGVQLQFNPLSPNVHVCPADLSEYRGELLNTAWYWFVNHHLSQGAFCLSILWRLFGNSDHLSRVKTILMGYATKYSGYLENSDSRLNGGIVTHQTLDEAVWVLPLVWAFDLISETLEERERQAITEKLLLPTAEFLVQNHYMGVHNFACWHNAAIATIGEVIDRDDLVDFATFGPFGLQTQLDKGVADDGLWLEGSFSYHFYALAGVMAQLKATDRGFVSHPAVVAMLQAPIRCAFPDGTLPAINDCWYFTGLLRDCCHGIPPAASFCEIGFLGTNDLLSQRFFREPTARGRVIA